MGGLFLPIVGPSSDVAWSAERGARAARAGDSPRRLRNARPLEQAHQALLPQRLSPGHASRVFLLALPLVLLIPFFSLPPSPFPLPWSVCACHSLPSRILLPSSPPLSMDRWMGEADGDTLVCMYRRAEAPRVLRRHQAARGQGARRECQRERKLQHARGAHQVEAQQHKKQ